MPEAEIVALAALAGGCCALAILAAFAAQPLSGLGSLVARLRSRAGAVTGRAVFEASIEKAGWHETPERLAVLSLSMAACGAVVAGALDPVLAPAGLVMGAVVVPIAASRAIADRR